MAFRGGFLASNSLHNLWGWKNYDPLTIEGILNKLSRIKFSVGCIVWPWWILFQIPRSLKILIRLFFNQLIFLLFKIKYSLNDLNIVYKVWNFSKSFALVIEHAKFLPKCLTNWVVKVLRIERNSTLTDLFFIIWSKL